MRILNKSLARISLSMIFLFLLSVSVYYILTQPKRVYAVSTSTQMIPNNITAKSYKMSADETCEGTPADATVAYVDADYNAVNTSNDAYFLETATAAKTDFIGDCNYTRWAFNVTQVNTTGAIQWIYYCMEGYNTLVYANGDGALWYSIAGSWYRNQTLTSSDTTYCWNITTNPNSYINADGTFQIGADATATGDGANAETSRTYIDYVSVTVGYVGAAISNSCTPPSTAYSEWWINCTDNCNLSTVYNMNRSRIYINGTGRVNITANVFNISNITIKGISASQQCIVTCKDGCFQG